MYNVITGFGHARRLGQAGWEFHNAIDLNGFENIGFEKVFSPVSGQISGVVLDGVKNLTDIYIVTQLNNVNYRIDIGHLDNNSISVLANQTVSAGDYLGDIGEGFWSTRHSHTHIEIHKVDVSGNLVAPPENAIKFFIDRGVPFVQGTPVLKSFDQNNDKLLFDTNSPATFQKDTNVPKNSLFGHVTIIAEAGIEYPNFIVPQIPRKLSYSIENNLGKTIFSEKYLYDLNNGPIVGFDYLYDEGLTYEYQDNTICTAPAACPSTSIQFNYNYKLLNGAQSGFVPLSRLFISLNYLS